MIRMGNYEEFIKNIVQCEEYQKSLNDSNHPCHDIVDKRNLIACEPFRSPIPIDDVEVMFSARASFLNVSIPQYCEECQKKEGVKP